MAARERGAALLRFLRVPAAPTAPADVLAGFAFAAGPDPPLSAAALAAAASLFLYLAGMGLNDLADRRHDSVHRPTRPIPAGALSLGWARAVVAGCLVLGLSFAALAGGSLPAVAVLLAALIAAYDLGGKRVPFVGPLVMGSCRGVNLYLGMIAAGGGAGVTLLVLHGIYTASLTLAAEHEEGDAVPSRFLMLAIASAACPLAAAAAIASPWTALPFSGVLAAVLIGAAWKARQTLLPADVRTWVKLAVLGFLLYDAAILAGSGRTSAALVCVALVPICLFLGRRYPPS